MKKLEVMLNHCYGIKNMEHIFDFTHDNVIAIYARNGVMKTSFAKTLKQIQKNKIKEVRDEIFSIASTVAIKIDDKEISPKDLFVINSFESDYQANITPLLVNDTIKTRLHEVLEARDALFRDLEKKSGLKITKTVAGKSVYELETTIVKDFNFENGSFLLNIDSFLNNPPMMDLSLIQYSRIFVESVEKKILSPEFQSKIREYIERSNKIYSLTPFLSKGGLTLPKLKDVHKSLKKDSYFTRGNTIVLANQEVIQDENELVQQILKVEAQLRDVSEFKDIEKMLSDVGGTSLKDIIEVHPEIVDWFSKEKLSDLKRCFWLSYIQKSLPLFDALYEKYNDLTHDIESVTLDNTPWKEALQIYKDRFSVPYEMEITNLKSAIIGESVPRVEFSFTDEGRTTRISRDELDKLNTLSQGEKRALYLLNIIFNIEEIKRKGEKKLFIVDDIADSFDYKNKYAIIEYLCEIAQDERYSMIILSHNFDFYRTITSRLGLRRENRLYARSNNGDIVLEEEYYQNQPFLKWKEAPTGRTMIAMIPFVRNLIEFGKDCGLCVRNDKEGWPQKDYDLLTMLLHEKRLSSDITFSDLKEIYSNYLGIDFSKKTIDINWNSRILDVLYDYCETLNKSEAKLEDKILLAMATRHKAEIYMKNRLSEYTGQLKGPKNRIFKTAEDFLLDIDHRGNQTRNLLMGYKQFGEKSIISILESVEIMTPENIHLNSFMYEPIVDMDITELIGLYKKVKVL